MSANWISDTNRFSLEAPPDWWLRKLQEFDRSLVVIPSRQDCVYRLAQRRPLNLPEKVVNDALFKESDTQMLASYSLVPVTSIKAKPNWFDPYMFVELANRAPWRQGGADEVIKRVEAQEAAAELDKQLAIDDMTTQVARDAWGMYNKKIGVRSHMYVPRTKDSLVSSKSPSFRVK